VTTDFDRELNDSFGELDPQAIAEADLALDIAIQFAALRRRRGLSQKELADRLGRTQQAVSKIENPSHKGHNLARLKEAVAAMNATLDITIVPLQDAEAYQALYPPKPVLEDVSTRGPRIHRSTSETMRPARQVAETDGLLPYDSEAAATDAQARG
jgi:transcriptional regulator with XRE-family HTH domain